MVIYKFPGIGNNQQHHSQSQEDIIVETSFTEIHVDPKSSFNFSVSKSMQGCVGRLLFAIASCMAFFWSFTALVMLIMSLPVGLITLFQWKSAKDFILRAWVLFKAGLTVTVGFSIAVFSPILGVGMLCFYFLALQPDFSRTMFWKIIQDYLIRRA